MVLLAAFDVLVARADSTDRRNNFAEHLSGCLEAKRFTRPLIQLSRGGVELPQALPVKSVGIAAR
jgi:hypothetical protein